MIGAGAAGLMAAIHAAGPGRRVLLLERTTDGGRKILISGGGRCNVLPGRLDERRFVTGSSPNTLRNILRSWPLPEQRDFFEQTLQLPLVLEPESGKLFPVANRARVVRDALVRHAQSVGVEWIANTHVVGIDADDARWRLSSAGGTQFRADAVIIATGGLSVPATGSDGFGLDTLRALGHRATATYPALTPLTFDPPRFGDLAGVSLNVTISATSETVDAAATGGFLFTHRGYSGPAVLDVAHVPVRARADGITATVRVQWTPLVDADWEARLASSPQTALGALRSELPNRLADRLLADADIDARITLAQLTRSSRLRLISLLVRYPLPTTGDEGYRKAEVTGGGIALDQVNPRTLESKRSPGLFLAGELLDAFGPIGGYNFAWAWATGRLAGLGAAAAVTGRK